MVDFPLFFAKNDKHPPKVFDNFDKYDTVIEPLPPVQINSVFLWIV